MVLQKGDCMTRMMQKVVKRATRLASPAKASAWDKASADTSATAGSSRLKAPDHPPPGKTRPYRTSKSKRKSTLLAPPSNGSVHEIAV